MPLRSGLLDTFILLSVYRLVRRETLLLDRDFASPPAISDSCLSRNHAVETQRLLGLFA